MFKAIFKIFCKSLVVFFVFLSLAFVSKGWQLLTDGFRTDKIVSEVPYNPDWDIDISDNNVDEVLNILNQNFYYLDKGCQTYVFESADKKYVLKFIRYHKYRLPFWMRIKKLFSKLDMYSRQRLQHREKSFFNSMRSYKLSYDHLQDETGVVYIHLNKSEDIFKNLPIIDRLNRKKHIDLDSAGFLLQRKTQRLEDVLVKLRDEKNIDGMKQVIQSFLNVVTSMCKKQIVNRDYNCVKIQDILKIMQY
jgi:hypothetical protein